MKGIILAGGRGTRLHPITLGTCKQLLPIYDKPMIYYPLAVLMMAGIRDVLLITNPEDELRFRNLLGNGSQLGITLDYAVQPRPEGIAQSFLIAESWLSGQPVALVLGDNIFYGPYLEHALAEGASLQDGALVFGYEVHDPERYGVVEFDEERRVLRLVEKPKQPCSRYAVTGLYFYDSDVVELAKGLTPSARGELEITDLNNAYLAEGRLRVRLLGRGFAWLDTGTVDSLQKASLYVEAIQERQGIKIGCIEEIAYQQKWISPEQLLVLAQQYGHGEYGQYLHRLSSEPIPL